MAGVDRLRAGAVRNLAEFLRESFQRLAADAPVKGFKQLAESFEAFSGWLIRYYDAAIARAKNDPYPDQSVSRTDRVFSAILREVQQNCARLIHPPGVEDFPDELAAWSKQWICHFGGYDPRRTSVALVPQWPFTYVVAKFPNPLQRIRDEVEQLLGLPAIPGLKRAEAKYADSFLHFAFPRIEGRDILFQPILLHEFGHTIDWNNSLMEQVYTSLGLSGPTKSEDDERLTSWIREFIADLLATRLGGPCFALALQQLSVIANVLDQDSPTHPASRFRLSMIVEHLQSMGYFASPPGSLVEQAVREWLVDLSVDPTKNPFPGTRSTLLNPAARSKMHAVVEGYCRSNNLTPFDCDSFKVNVPSLVTQLRRGVPPVLAATHTDHLSPLPPVFNAAWELWLSTDPVFDDFHETANRGPTLHVLSGLAFKAVQAAEVVRLWKKGATTNALHQQSGPTIRTAASVPNAAVLTEAELRRRIREQQIIITPLLDRAQVGEGSINLRLGTDFIITRVADLPSFKPHEFGEEAIRRYQERVSKTFGEPFVLHPGRLVLAATLEYIALPLDCAALVLSRSSYGRLGLIVATAVYVQPGWKGCLTLELSNAADIPIELLCGAPIAQLVVFSAQTLRSKPKLFPAGRRPYPTFPEFSPLKGSPEWKRLQKIAEHMRSL